MLSYLLSKYISSLKGQSYIIDSKVPSSYLLSLFSTRMLMKLRGLLSGINNAPFIGANAVINCRRMIKCGKGVSIQKHCHIDALSSDGIIFGNNVSVGYKTTIECTGNLQHLGKGFIVGNNVGLGTNNFFGCAGGIYIGDDTIIGNFVTFHSENHIFSDLKTPIRLQGVSHEGINVGKNCWIGAKSTILDGAIIEDGCIIAAGALVVSGRYEANGIYGGVPAKLIKRRI